MGAGVKYLKSHQILVNVSNPLTLRAFDNYLSKQKILKLIQATI